VNKAADWEDTVAQTTTMDASFADLEAVAGVTE
jgi:hypothetical protein